jgi:exodeoxyribonuclease VII large subunit
VTYRPSPAPAGPVSAAPAPRVVGVKRLADYLRRKLESDGALRNVSVRGEISNYSVQKSGHVNFDLKEGEAVIRCFAWASDASAFPALSNGVAIVATGGVSTYAPKSVYQLVVRSAVLEGVGNLHALFEERKKLLAAEGVFDAARKRALPAFPFRVALVSSRTSDGAIDFVTLLHHRAPHVAVVWYESAVQGTAAPAELCAALRRASAADVDCIVVTRGGGSFEDLFPFSDESVVRAVAKARHPVISAIGHTADQQLCDFAADLHVETPSAAAKAIGFATSELLARTNDRVARARRSADLSFDRRSARLHHALVRSKLVEPRSFLLPLVQRVAELDGQLGAAVRAAANGRLERVRGLVRRLEVHDPSRRLAERGLALGRLAARLDAAEERVLQRARNRRNALALALDPVARVASERFARRLELALVRLDGNSPERLLKQGYAMVTFRGAIVRDPVAVPLGEVVEARLAHGTLSARVEARTSEGDAVRDTLRGADQRKETDGD